MKEIDIGDVSWDGYRGADLNLGNILHMTVKINHAHRSGENLKRGIRRGSNNEGDGTVQTSQWSD